MTLVERRTRTAACRPARAIVVRRGPRSGGVATAEEDRCLPREIGYHAGQQASREFHSKHRSNPYAESNSASRGIADHLAARTAIGLGHATMA
jgi:hypothetical protein